MNFARISPLVVMAAICAAGAALAQSRAAGEIDLSNPLWSTPLELLSVTRERPLFSPTRRPSAVAPPTVAPQASSTKSGAGSSAAAPPPFVLVGTALGAYDTLAVLFDPSASKAITLRPGASASGWTLKSVSSRAVELERDGARATLLLTPPAGDSTSAAVQAPQAPPPSEQARPPSSPAPQSRSAPAPAPALATPSGPPITQSAMPPLMPTMAPGGVAAPMPTPMPAALPTAMPTPAPR